MQRWDSPWGSRGPTRCGQRAVLGFNLNKLVRDLAERRDAVLVG